MNIGNIWETIIPVSVVESHNMSDIIVSAYNGYDSWLPNKT